MGRYGRARGCRVRGVCDRCRTAILVTRGRAAAGGTGAAAAAGPAGRVVVIERVLGNAWEDQREITHQDLRLFVLFGGRERSRQDFTALGTAAGLTLTDDHPAAAHRHLLVFRTESPS